MPTTAELDAPALLREARCILEMTQTAFGERLGVTKRTVMRWEKGTTVATCFHLLHAACLIEVKAPDRAQEMRAAAHFMAHALGMTAAELESSPMPGLTGDALAIETFVDGVAKALGLRPETVRPALRAAVVQADLAGLTLPALRRGLG